MMRATKQLLLALFFTAFAQAAPAQVRLMVQSEPPGAAVIQNNQIMGHTPLVLRYPRSVFNNSPNACVQTLPLTLRWESGAQRTDAISLCKETGRRQEITLNRPNAPGLQTDLFVAEGRRLQAEQDALATRQLAIQAIQALSGNPNPQPVAPGFGTFPRSIPAVCNCKGYDGPGGPCYAGPGGPAYNGPGGPAYSGPGGACYAGPGGPMYGGPGGPMYDGPGGPAYSGPGGPAYDGPGGACYAGPGGPAYDGPGGPCYRGPGGTGQNCPAICR